MLAREEARHEAVASASGKLAFETIGHLGRRSKLTPAMARLPPLHPALNRRLINLVRLGSGLLLGCSDVRAIKGDGDATTFNKWN
jgi:hypothetical protein